MLTALTIIRVSPAKPPPTNYSSQSHVFIKISSDNVERPVSVIEIDIQLI